MFDRRILDRKFLTYFARVTDKLTGRMLGYLVDLSPSGAQLIGDVPLKIGTDFSLSVDLPDGLTDQKQVDIEVCAMWNQPDVDPEFYRTGLRFIKREPEDQLVLDILLSHYSAIN